MFDAQHQFRICRLSDNFFESYPKTEYPEILEKRDRPYHCMIFEISDTYCACVPYRTQIKHPYAFHFRNSVRSIAHKSGLDYTKTVIINRITYLNTEQMVIDQDEYVETVRNMTRIKKEVFDFIEKYRKHIRGEEVLHPLEYRRRYCYSPLKYFHHELGI